MIHRLVRLDRTAVSSALLACAGIGSGERMRTVVLASVSEAAYRARAEGVIGERRSAQIARHVKRASDAMPVRLEDRVHVKATNNAKEKTYDVVCERAANGSSRT
jgi:hypothetical protein